MADFGTLPGARLSWNEYKTLVEQAPILIWRANTSGACDYFNNRWLAFRGRTMEQEYGDGWAEGVHGDDLADCVATYRSSFGRRETFEMEYRLLRYDGVYRWIFDRGSPYYEDGEFGGYIGSCIDVTDRVDAQEAVIRRRLAELKQLSGLIPICSVCQKIRDEKGRWRPLAAYISERTMTEFTHGYCPDCMPVP
jgi:PAS domain S-box-containing protein